MVWLWYGFWPDTAASFIIDSYRFHVRFLAIRLQALRLPGIVNEICMRQTLTSQSIGEISELCCCSAANLTHAFVAGKDTDTVGCNHCFAVYTVGEVAAALPQSLSVALMPGLE